LQRFTQTVYLDCKSEKSCQKMLYFGYVFVFGTQLKGRLKVLVLTKTKSQRWLKKSTSLADPLSNVEVHDW